MKVKDFEDLQASIVDWADMHELLKSENARKQFLKFIEEIFEFKTEMDLLNLFGADEFTFENIELEMGDIFVTLIILCEQLNISPQKCLSMAYEKIKDRKGKTINGVFIKEGDLK